MTTAQVQSMLGSKFWGPFFSAKYAAPHMARDGSITFVSGAAAYRPEPGATIVAAVNAALEGMGKGLSLELKPVRVNAVSPGVVDSGTWNFLADQDRQGLFDAVAGKMPVGKVGQPEDVAQAIMMVMLNAFMTGSVIPVDGGAGVA